MFNVRERPLEWRPSSGQSDSECREWYDCLMGFFIHLDADAQESSRYRAVWGEAYDERFPNLDSAMRGCQQRADAWTSRHACAEKADSHAEPPREAGRIKALINSPEIEQFLRGVHVEAVHQVERWGTVNDRAKTDADWFWLVGYLAGKALRAATAGNTEKAKHHTISTAAALYNWHCAITGADVRMCPGRSDLAEMVESLFPGETAAGA